jgi:phosphatidylglycerol:prolipoprotein diacylglycerol transferase
MRTGLRIGPLTLNYYGLIIMIGVIAAAVMSYYEAKRRKLDPEFIWDSLPWVVIGGVIGARIWHILTPSTSSGITAKYYFTHPLKAIAIWDGGLGIPGAVAGGALVLYLYSRKRNQSFLLWADIIAPGLALAQAIGRWGNYINQELYGSPSNLPWAITIDPQHRLPEFKNVATYHPLFLYESILNLLNMGFLMWLHRKMSHKLKEGDVFLFYLITYPTIRFFLEFLRLDRSYVGGVNANQTLMIIIALVSVGFLLWRHRETVFGRKGKLEAKPMDVEPDDTQDGSQGE